MAHKWWSNSVIYQVYLPSLKDSNKDGIGDIRGLISQLDYFQCLGIETILLSPFYPSPMKDNGFDISSYEEIDPVFGSIEDFDALVIEMKKRNLKLLLNFVPNHTSEEHFWFPLSVARTPPFGEYYVWADGKEGHNGPEPPNNWRSVFGGSAWTWNEKRQQYYLHQFLAEQPDLNLRSPHVRDELRGVLRFWLKRGVDGFRVDAASHLFENEELLNEPVGTNPAATEDSYDYLDHIYTKGQRENLDIIKEWRDVLDEYGGRGSRKILLTETYEDFNSTMKYFGSVYNPISDIPLNWDLLGITQESTACDLLQVIRHWTEGVPIGKHPNWLLGSHDHSRLATRVGHKMLDGLHMVTLLMEGTVICYYGDEIGMENVAVREEDMKDTYALRTIPDNSRDPARTPMQWSNELNAGFTDHVRPWLPIHENYATVNVETQQLCAVSHLQIFKKLLDIRKEPAIQAGFQDFPVVTESVFSMVRMVAYHAKGFLMMMNMGNSTCNVDFTAGVRYLPDFADLEVSNTIPDPGQGVHPQMDLRDIRLEPKEAMVLSFTA